MITGGALDSLINSLLQNKNTRSIFTCSNVMSLIKAAVPVIAEDPTVIDIEPPVHICGDVHGQFVDLLRSFQCGGLPPDSKYLFLGDYVDRGKQSLEVICLLYALKIKYPKHIYLIRGNHESPEMTEYFGFLLECQQKVNGEVWKEFCKSFRYLPLAAVIGEKFFCIHGGLTPELKSINQIREIKRPLDIPEEGMIANLLWSDPDSTIKEWGPNERGTTICYGLNPVERFLRNNNLKMIIRGHQMAQEGYNFPFGSNESVVTVFTASKYAGQCDNKAAYMTIFHDGNYEFTTLPSWIPVIPLRREKVVHPGTPRKRASLGGASKLPIKKK